MSTPMLTSFVSNNNETPTNKKQAAASRINSAPIRTLTTTTKFSSTSFNNLKQQPTTKLNHSDPLERFTIDYVIKRGYFNLVRYLLTLGLDPNYVSTKESYPFMYTPLIYCTFIKDEKWALSLAQNLLERGADLKKTDNNRLNPIHYCCAFGLEKLLKLFLESVDFDLSKALDINGNNCMHYAIRSHNLNCVKLIIDQFKPNDMYKRIDIKNSFGLRPSQIEDEIDFSQSKYFNYKFNGKDSLQECKLVLTDFIRELTILRTIIVYKPLIDLKPVNLNEEIKTSKASKTKKRSGKLKSKKNSKSSSASSDKSEFKSNFFQTEIEPIIEETKPNTAATSPKPRKKSSRSSKKDSFEEKIIEPELKIEPVIQQPDIIESISPVLIDEKPLDKEKAKQLTIKSFTICLKERLGNLIIFNEVFVSKEHMFKSIINTNNENVKLHRSSSLKPSLSRLINEDKIDDLMSNETVKTWKTQLPSMFLNMECLLTPSYRETVHPLSSSPNLFKRSLKKSSKKSSSTLDASSRPNSILKRQQSALKSDRKNSVIQEN